MVYLVIYQIVNVCNFAISLSFTRHIYTQIFSKKTLVNEKKVCYYLFYYHIEYVQIFLIKFVEKQQKNSYW